jgi:hypothetical protein
MSSTRRALFALTLLGALTSCEEEKGVCISTLGPICNANFPKRACDGDGDEYVAVASPSAAVAYCKAQGFFNAMPKSGPGLGPIPQEQQDKALAAGDFVSFSKHR